MASSRKRKYTTFGVYLPQILLPLQVAILNTKVMFTIFIILCIVSIIIAIASSQHKNEHPTVDDGIRDVVSQVLDSSSSITSTTTEIDLNDDRKFWDGIMKIILERHSTERSITFTVVGGYYRSKAAQEEYINLDKASPISLRKEPDNRHDPYAVKVLSDRKHIGYVPKDLSRLVTDVIDQKCVSECYVVDNDYAFRHDDADGMQVTLWITDAYENRLDLDGIEPPEGAIE